MWKEIIIQSQKTSLRTVSVPAKIQIGQIWSTNQKHPNFGPVIHMNKMQSENFYADVT